MVLVRALLAAIVVAAMTESAPTVCTNGMLLTWEGAWMFRSVRERGSEGVRERGSEGARAARADEAEVAWDGSQGAHGSQRHGQHQGLGQMLGLGVR